MKEALWQIALHGHLKQQKKIRFNNIIRKVIVPFLLLSGQIGIVFIHENFEGVIILTIYKKIK